MTIPAEHDQARAQEDLAYIRATMESASTFTAVSGWGLVTVGFLGLAASWITWTGGNAPSLSIWVPTALLAVLASGVGNAIKAKTTGVPLWSGSFRKMVWVMAPALGAGGVLTFALAAQGAQTLLPGLWLLLYGAGVTAGGTFSVGSIRWLGVAHLVLGALALLMPDKGIVFVALGFGGLHVGFGLNIVRRHGG